MYQICWKATNGVTGHSKPVFATEKECIDECVKLNEIYISIGLRHWAHYVPD